MRIGSVVIDRNDFEATRHPSTPEPAEDFIVLEDPEGNLFCVIDAAPEADAQGG